MNDQEFQATVLSQLSAMNVKLDSLAATDTALKLTLYGENGTGGIVADVNSLKNDMTSRQKWWNWGLLVAIGLLGAAAAYFKK